MQCEITPVGMIIYIYKRHACQGSYKAVLHQNALGDSIDPPCSSEVGGDIAVERRAPHLDIGFGFGSCSCCACGRIETAWASERPPLARPRRGRLTPSFGWHEVVRGVSLWCLVVSRGAPRCLVGSRDVSCGVSCGVSRVVSRGVSCVGSCGVSWCLYRIGTTQVCEAKW